MSTDQPYFSVLTNKQRHRSRDNDKNSPKGDVQEGKLKPLPNSSKVASEQDSRFVIFSPYVRPREPLVKQHSSEKPRKVKKKRRATSQPDIIQNDTSNISFLKGNDTVITENDYTQNENTNKSYVNQENKEEKLSKKPTFTLELPQIEARSKSHKKERGIHLKSPSLDFEINKQISPTKNHPKTNNEQSKDKVQHTQEGIEELPPIHQLRKMNPNKLKLRTLSINPSHKVNQSLIEPQSSNNKEMRSRRNHPYKVHINRISTMPAHSSNIQRSETSELFINSFDNKLKSSLPLQRARKPSGTSEHSDPRSTDLSTFIQPDCFEDLSTAQEISSLLNVPKEGSKRNKSLLRLESKEKSNVISISDQDKKKISKKIEEAQNLAKKEKTDDNYENKINKDISYEESKKDKERPLLPSIETNHSNKLQKKLTTEQRYEKLIVSFDINSINIF